MKWMVSLGQLDAVQQQVIADIVADHERTLKPRSQPAKSASRMHWVRGFAGSGKTIVLTHVAEQLAPWAAKNKYKIAMATYTHALKDMIESGLTPSARARVQLLTFDALASVREAIDVLVADEVQDVTQRYFDAFRRASPFLVVAADFDQRIFRQAARQQDIESLLSKAVTHDLADIYRINENVLRVATAVHSTVQIHPDAQVDVKPERTQLIVARTVDEEWDLVYDEAMRVAAPQFPCAVLLPTKKLMEEFFVRLAKRNVWGQPPGKKDWGISASWGSDVAADPYGRINAYLAQHEAGLQVFGSGSGELSASSKKKLVYLMTYHSAKGLEFEYVFLPRLCQEVNLQPMRGGSDLEERRLFFVAATRARRQLYLSYSGPPHRLLAQIPSHLLDAFKPPKRFRKSP